MNAGEFQASVNGLQAEMNKLMGQLQGGLLKNPSDKELLDFGSHYGPWYEATSQQNQTFLAAGPTAATEPAHERHKQEFWAFYAEWSAIMDKRGQGMKKLPRAGADVGTLLKWGLALWAISRGLS